MRYFTTEDIIDIYAKLKLRGLPFLLSKFNSSGLKRTKSAFNKLHINAAHSWHIPMVQQRWNKLISGDSNNNFKNFLIDNHLKGRKKLKMLSLGCGRGEHEIEFAQQPFFEEIVGMDISDSLINHARDIVMKKGLNNISFKTQDAYTYNFPEAYFDIIFFHASLHHFKNIEKLVETLKRTLKSDGLLIINEYVGRNRLQYPKQQLVAINKSLKLIPKKWKQRFKLPLYKNNYSGSGILRMIIADPSECVESEQILPVIHDNFSIVCERPFGGNIIIPALKDISHHFLELDDEKEKVLQAIFDIEDTYLQVYPSDYIFGIYKN